MSMDQSVNVSSNVHILADWNLECVAVFQNFYPGNMECVYMECQTAIFGGFRGQNLECLHDKFSYMECVRETTDAPHSMFLECPCGTFQVSVRVQVNLHIRPHS